MNNLFSDPLLGVGLPVLVGFCLLLLILIILDMRSIRSITLEEAYKVVRRSKEYRPLVAAAILINIFAWTIGRSSLEERVSPLTLFFI